MEKRHWEQLYDQRLKRFLKLVKLKAPQQILAGCAEGIMLAGREKSRRQIAFSWFSEWVKGRIEYTHYQIVRFFKGEKKADELLFGINDDDDDELTSEFLGG